MTTMSLGKVGRSALLISPVVIVITGFFALLYLVRPRNTTFVMILTAAVAIFVMAYFGYLARRVQRRMDEVQIANQSFATAHGWVWGMGITATLLMVPPVTNLLIDLASRLATGSPDISNRASMLVALAFGYILLVLMQAVGNAVASMIWQRRMSTPQQ